MAFTQIPVDRGSPWGNKLERFRNLLNDVVNLGRELTGKMSSMVDGTDYSQLESQFGLTATGTNTDSTGYSAKFQVESVMARVDSDALQDNAKSVIQQFINQVG